MNVEIRDLSSTRKEIEVLVPKEDVNKACEELYREVSRGASVKGFRKGKAPLHILKMYYGDYIKEELTKKLVSDNLDKATKENDIFVVSFPEIEKDEPKENEDFKFTAKFDVKPEVKPEKYTGFELKRVVYEVSDEDVDQVLNRLKEGYATVEDVTDESYQAAAGDYVIVDVDCEENSKISRNKMTVEAGGRSFIPGLQDEVLGLKTGDEKTAEITFPEDHFMEDARGKTLSVKLSVQGIKHRILPELDDAFAGKIREGVSTMEELKGFVREDLNEGAHERTAGQIRAEVVEKLLEANAFEVPESMVKMQASMMIRGMHQRLSSQGMSLQDLYPDAESLKEETLATSEKTIRQALLIEAIAKLENIETTDDDLNAELGIMAKRYNLPLDQVRQGLEESDRMEEIKFNTLEKKVVDFIINSSTVTETVEKMEEATA